METEKIETIKAGEMVESIAAIDHPLARLLALKIALEEPESLPTANRELADLAPLFNRTLPPACHAKYWQSADGLIQRVYVTRKGKKAGFVTLADGKARYEECVLDDLIAAFQSARKTQKAARTEGGAR